MTYLEQFANFIEQDITNSIDDAWDLISIDCHRQHKTLKLYLVGSRPGARKSRLISIIEKINKDNIFIINSDEFRKYHPQYLEFQKQNDKTADFIAKASKYLLKSNALSF